MIQLDSVSKHYRQENVLSEITLHFTGRVIYGLVGPNGCGKTTLMRCICGFTRPSSGTVTVLGKRIGKDCDFAPSTGIIIETPGFLPHENARRNLTMLAGISGKASRARVDEVLRLVDWNLKRKSRWASIPWACDSGWPLLRPSWKILRFSFWTSPLTGWTKMALQTFMPCCKH